MRNGNERIGGVESNADYIHLRKIGHCMVNTLSVKARGAPKLPTAKEKEQKERGSQGKGGSPTKRELRDAGYRGESDKHRRCCGYKQPVQHAAAW